MRPRHRGGPLSGVWDGTRAVREIQGAESGGRCPTVEGMRTASNEPRWDQRHESAFIKTPSLIFHQRGKVLSATLFRLSSDFRQRSGFLRGQDQQAVAFKPKSTPAPTRARGYLKLASRCANAWHRPRKARRPACRTRRSGQVVQRNAAEVSAVGSVRHSRRRILLLRNLEPIKWRGMGLHTGTAPIPERISPLVCQEKRKLNSSSSTGPQDALMRNRPCWK